MLDARIARARALLTRDDLDALVVMKPQNRRYLTGFTGSAGVAVVAAAETALVVDFRYVEQARTEAPGARVVPGGAQPFDAVVEALRDRRRIGFEREFMTVGTHQRLRERLPEAEFVGLDDVDALRAVKDDAERATIARAAQIADRALERVRPLLRPGVREREVAVALEVAMRELGAAGPAFETIVASGPRGALPHGRASDRVIERGDLVTIDWGAALDGYHSDCTRTFAVGPAGDRAREIYTVVLEAQRAALDSVRPGVPGSEVDAVARRLITEAGYGEQFGHGLGHGVGLEVHEAPTLNTRGNAPIQAGTVVTIEPGIYLPGFGGVRIEDLVVVEEQGPSVLTGLSTEWTEL